jgi:hypothetical protein
MKHAKLSILLVLVVSFAKAQNVCDTIHFINKEVKLAKIVEINQASVKYNRCDNLTGPLYVLDRSEVYTIKYANGIIDSFNVNKQPPTTISNPSNNNKKCDTIFLRDGTKFLGVIKAVSSRVIKLKDCEDFNKPVIIIYRNDIKNDYTDTYLQDRMEVNNNRRRKRKNPADTVSYFHVGIIPYQILTRSSGIYVRYDYKKFGFEYKPTYTFATNLAPNSFSPPLFFENFYFQGINNSIVLYGQFKHRTKIGLMLSYKHWWHGKEAIYNTQSLISGEDTYPWLIETKSTIMNGFGIGIELIHDFSRENFDFSFFYNVSITEFTAYSHVYSADSYNFAGLSLLQQHTYPYTETNYNLYFNITAGFKFGYRKPVHAK